MSGPDWNTVDRLGRARYGLIRPDAVPLTKSQRQHARKNGQLRIVQPGVLRAAGAPRTAESELLAAVWAAGGGAAGSHLSAARALELVDDWPANPQITVPPPRFPRLAGVDVHRSAALTPGRIVVVDHIPVTNPFLTLIQLGAVAEVNVVAMALERALGRRLLTMTGMRRHLDELGRSGRSGAGVLRSIVESRALGDAASDSPLEEAAARIWGRFHLAPPVYHYLICDAAGRVVAEVDFAYPDIRFALEFDGWEAHGTPMAQRRDYERQADAEDLGWTFRRFTRYDVMRRPAYVARRIKAVLRAHGITG
jgi:hypothetical protein